ncbi:LamG domain-containing protein [Planoprotostelium fungivorum]|uniref:LamG domain-containing protein n=1 Tax=Planoprotostelium fungivorum TaxID=1890364 RepID=A0A2P6MWM2_9EUKA|nr:LamG domain-containing protein [Planoprotostelium fungivorum]
MKHAITLLFLALTTTAAYADSVAAESASATNVVIPSSPVESPIYFTPAANYLQKKCGLPWLYWSFDNTKERRCTDDSGHGRHGTFNTNVSIVAGKLRRGCDWKRNSLFFITLPQFVLESFTMATWLRLDSTQGENIIASTKRGQFDGWELSLDAKAKVITFHSSHGDSVQWKSDSLRVGAWIHLAITVSPTRVKLYLDGISSGSKDIARIVQSGSSLYVGGKQRADPVHGTLDEFLIFDRVLDKEEITDAMSKYRSASLVPNTNWSKQTKSYEWGAGWELDTKHLTAVRMNRLQNWWIF